MMRPIAVLVCTAFLCCVSLETTEDHPPTRESNTADAGSRTAEWDETAPSVWKEDQTGEVWDKGHLLSWLYGAQSQVNTPVIAKREGSSCSCSTETRDCRCCFKFTILGKKFSACLVGYYHQNDGIGVVVEINSQTIINRNVRVTDREVSLCKTFLTRGVCVGLNDIRLESNSISAHAKFEIQGIIDKNFGEIVIPIGAPSGGRGPSISPLLGHMLPSFLLILL
ncbi:uncharacterized protein LOC110975967 [Acanthaster planci]|uniref:Uncharacterized protein LOC110975967 n=1 Tax=Acanthaster planci TaxID=133434 RepID=A0A8B7XUL9_ACAPL|nr:uncharacterized protein LOC110975967 [Acanthaster planci]